MSFTINETSIKILNNDLLNVIQDYKNSAEWFEEHSKKMNRVNEELKRPFELIKNTYQRYPNMNLNIGSGILDLIHDMYVLDDDEIFIDYGNLDDDEFDEDNYYLHQATAHHTMMNWINQPTPHTMMTWIQPTPPSECEGGPFNDVSGECYCNYCN